MKSIPAITSDPIAATLFRLSAPMVLGTLANVLFSLTVTIFVARLGTLPLTAVSFTLPIVFLVGGAVTGLETGASAVFAHRIGRRGPGEQSPFASAALILSLFLALLLILFGMTTINPLFRLFGASDDVLVVLRPYMRIYYFGLALEIPLAIGAGLIRALGHARFSGNVLLLKAGLNAALVPWLMFGGLGLPALGLPGAAWAGLLAESLTLAPMVWMLRCRLRLLSFAPMRLEFLLAAWRSILHLGVPAMATNCMVPISYGAITRLAASLGPQMVATLGLAVRIESFAFVLISALQYALIPFFGQNLGAQRMDRLRKGELLANGFSIGWGFVVWGLLVLFQDQVMRTLTDDPVLMQPLRLFLWIVPAGYGMQGVFRFVLSIFSAIQQPFPSVILNIIRLFGFYVPMAVAGARLCGVPGMWLGICLSNIFGGLLALVWLRRSFKQLEPDPAPEAGLS